MNSQMQDHLIAVIRENLPVSANLTNYLSDVLNIGRESAYRRIRGEIKFTFEEIAKLSQSLNFSIDHIVGIKKNEKAIFNIHMLQDRGCLDIYVNKMEEYRKIFHEISNSPNSKVRLSVNTMPYFFHIKHDGLSRFRIYKWLYQNQVLELNDKFADFTLPDNILETHKAFYKDIQKLPNITVIMDNNVFWSAAKDLEYFLKRGLITDKDLDVLKAELHDIVNGLENIAAKGQCQNGSKVEMYVSSVDLEASYLHIEAGNYQFSQIRTFSISGIDSFDADLCRIQKEWIESLKRYSVMISESGDMQRFEYMRKQHEYIERISRESTMC